MDYQPPRKISVIEPISDAMSRVNAILFDPFDIGKWFIIGFCAWLAQLGQNNGGGGNFNFGSPSHDVDFNGFRDSILANLPLVILIASVVIILIFALSFLFVWLSSRGKFMFLHCVALNKGEIAAPWKMYRRHGNSLTGFRIVVVGILLLICLALFALGFAAFLNFNDSFQDNIPMAVGLAILIGLLAVVLFLGIAIVLKFTDDFVVPIMYLYNCTCMEAWSHFKSLFSMHVGKFVVYLLFQIAINIAIGFIIITAVLLTCCIAGCLFNIPYIGSVFLLPIFVFQRAYSVYYLQQFGPQYDLLPYGRDYQPPSPGDGYTQASYPQQYPQSPVEPETDPADQNIWQETEPITPPVVPQEPEDNINMQPPPIPLEPDSDIDTAPPPENEQDPRDDQTWPPRPSSFDV